MPHVVSFLSSFPDYLDIVVQCTRKTEVRSWRTLFAYLPAPQQLFEESLEKGFLKTAGGYLLVLHTFQELETSSEQCIRLLRKAREAEDWDLCKELARFLMALDPSGDTLRDAFEQMAIEVPQKAGGNPESTDVHLTTPRPNQNYKEYLNGDRTGSISPISSESKMTDKEAMISPNGTTVSEDYFSSRS